MSAPFQDKAREAVPRFMDTKQVAERLGVKPQTVARWRMHGEGPPFITVGRRAVRYLVKDVVAYAEGQRCRNTLEAAAHRAR